MRDDPHDLYGPVSQVRDAILATVLGLMVVAAAILALALIFGGWYWWALAATLVLLVPGVLYALVT